MGRRATAVGVAAPAERERPASCDVAKPKEVAEEEEEVALRAAAAAGMAKEELSSVAVAMADGRTDGQNGMGSLDKQREG